MSKYRAIPTTIDGIRFASRAESHRYQELKLLIKAGQITDLVLQPAFPIHVNGQKICVYRSDFQYNELCDGVWTRIVEDVKSPFTKKNPVYRLKNKLLVAVHGITIREYIFGRTSSVMSKSARHTSPLRAGVGRRIPIK